jgi:succinate dehydrogenase/fumarate reductase flavoprotein subunit
MVNKGLNQHHYDRIYHIAADQEVQELTLEKLANEVFETDVLVIGGGLAGAFAAIKAREAGASQVVQVDKASMGRSGCSAFAAGVIQAFSPDEDDREDCLREAVMKSHFLCDQERLEDHLDDSADRINEMDGFGVEFVKTAQGKLQRQLGRGKFTSIMFHGGYQMMEAMRRTVLAIGVRIVDRVMIVDLLTDGGRIAGAIGFNTDSGQVHEFMAKSVVLAAGRTWLKTRRPGHRNLSGDGIAAAYRAGLTLTGFDSGGVNTGPAMYDIGPGNNMYMGSGATIVNAEGERFVGRYDPILKERTELHTLSTACAIEAKLGRTPLYLDMTHIEPEKVQMMKRVLPLPMMMYERAGILVGDRFTRKIEWVTEGPSVRGGLLVNRRYESTLPGLFACGDAMPQSGTWGQNALAGAMTSGARAGRHAAEYSQDVSQPRPDRDQISELKRQMLEPLLRKEGIEHDQAVLSLQEAVMPYDVWTLRDENRMSRALNEIESVWGDQVPLLKAYDPHYLRMALEARNMTLVALLILKSSLFRRESRETAREDYPYIDNINWLKWVTVKKEGEQIGTGAVDVPVERYRLKPEKGKILHPIWQVAEKQGIIRIVNGGVEWV